MPEPDHQPSTINHQRGNERLAGALRRGKALVAYVTAGDPDLETTAELVLELERAGADVVELGVRMASGFVYCVSRTGVTGARAELPVDLRALLERIRAATDRPIAVGFGVSTPEHVRQINEWADAAVVGSAIVDLVGKHGRDA